MAKVGPSDPDNLDTLGRFDTNHDGKIDDEEYAKIFEFLKNGRVKLNRLRIFASLLSFLVIVIAIFVGYYGGEQIKASIREPTMSTSSNTNELTLAANNSIPIQAAESGAEVMLGMLPFLIGYDPIAAVKAAPELVIIHDQQVGAVAFTITKFVNGFDSVALHTSTGEVINIYSALNATVTRSDGSLLQFCAACSPAQLKSLINTTNIQRAMLEFEKSITNSGEDCLDYGLALPAAAQPNTTFRFAPAVCVAHATAQTVAKNCPKSCTTEAATCQSVSACVQAIDILFENATTMTDYAQAIFDIANQGVPSAIALEACYEDMVVQCPGIIPTLPGGRKGRRQNRKMYVNLSDYTDSGCHPAMSVVELCGGGSVRMDELATGAMIRTQFGCEPVIGFAHQQKYVMTDYFLQQTLDNHTLFISTVDHYGFANGIEVAAADICVGDTVRTLSASGSEQASVVTHIGKASLDGAYHLMTPSGTYYVDGVLASTFTGQVPRSVWTVLTHYTTLRYNLGFPVAPDDDSETTFPLDLVYNMYREKVPEWMEVALLPVFLTSGVLIELYNTGLLQVVTIGFICKKLATKMMSARTK